MNKGKYVFAQVMSLLDFNEFNLCVQKYNGNYKVKSFTCWHQFLCLCFGQLSQRESLRDTVVCLNSHNKKLYHMGISKGVVRSTFAEANESRDYRIYQDFAQYLIQEAIALHKDTDATNLKIDAPIYAIDATVIDLCVSVFWWTPFRKTKAAIKLNTQLDLKCEIPVFISITDGKEHDVNSLDIITFEQGAFYIMDKGYIDYKRLYIIHKVGAFFVTRAKKNFSFTRIYSAEVEKSSGIICDQTIKLKGYYAVKNYPDKLRRIKYYDKELNRTFVFITNNFEIDAPSIAALYKNRWKIELFFKWIKQHLKIKTFWGQSKNAVYTQIWVAISIYALIATLQKKLNIERSRYETLQILSVSLFDKTPINQLLAINDLQKEETTTDNQLKIF